jgi:hypothetical protein
MGKDAMTSEPLMLGLPQREGVRVDQMTASRETIHRQRIDHMRSLADLTKDYALATTILLFSHGGWDRDPVADYVHNYRNRTVFWINLPVPMFKIESSYPPFNGDSWQDWEHRLLACPRDEWPDLERELCNLSAVDFRRQRVHYVRPYWLRLPDFLSQLRPNYRRGMPTTMESATIPVYTLALDGNWAGVFFEPGRGLDPAQVVLRPPSREAVAFAQAVLTTDSKPFAAMERAVSSDQGMMHAHPLLLPPALRSQDDVH